MRQPAHERCRPGNITNYGTTQTAHQPKEFYRPFYFEDIDMALNTITDRFDQEDFKKLMGLQQMLLKAMEGSLAEAEVKIKKILSAFGANFSEACLQSDLQCLAAQGFGRR